MWKPAEALEVSRTVRSQLRVVARAGKTPQKTARRAEAILLAAKGVSNSGIAAEVGLSRQAVISLRQRFEDTGLACVLGDASRPGRKRRISQKKIDAVVKKTLEQKPKTATHWSTRSMAAATGLSPVTVHRIWKDHGLKPHLTKTFKLSTDPKFVEKLRDIVGLYLNPPEHAIVLSVDEKSQIQALDRTQPLLPMRKGHSETHTHDYVRHGTATLFAALSVLDGTVIASVKKRHRHQEFLAFLKQINRETSRTLDLHLILDNYGTHKHPVVKAWLSKHPRFHLHFTPTSSSWLNMIERWFANLTEKRIRRGVFKSLRSLIRALEAYVRENNHNPSPITWTAKANNILAKITRCKEALETGH